MSGARFAVLLALTAACGRLGFSNRVDASQDLTSGPDPDAPLIAFDPGLITKLTVDAPLLDSPTPNGGDCGQYSQLAVFDDAMMASDLMPFATVDNAGTTLWFAYSCKYADLAWAETVGSWKPPVGMFQRYDGEPAQPGINEFVATTDTMSDNMAATALRQLHLVFAADNSVLGIGGRTRPSDSTEQLVPVTMTTPLALSASSYNLADDGVFNPPSGLPWAVQTGLGRDIIRVGDTYYLYSVHWDGVTMSPTGVELTSIAVSTSTDLTSQVFPAAPLITGWTDPSVSAWGGSYHMIARRLDTNSYYYVHGTAPDAFDFANAVPLGLAARAGAPGAWDGSLYTLHGLSGDPRVTTAAVVNGAIYIFYAAGIPLDAGATNKPSERRGLGVFSAPVPR